MSAALFGLAVGAVSFGPVADKVGRKTVLIIAVFIFSTCSIASAFAQNLEQLEILRFITGVGLGAAMPNAVTLLSELCPDNKRSLLVNTMFCGFPRGRGSWRLYVGMVDSTIWLAKRFDRGRHHAFDFVCVNGIHVARVCDTW